MKRIFLGYPFSLAYVRDVVTAAASGYAEVIVASDVLRGMPLLHKIEEIMKNADLCIFDLTLHNPNVAAEFGIAHAMQYRYAILYCTDEQMNPNLGHESSVFSDVKGWDSVLYANPDDLAEQLRRYLPELIGTPVPKDLSPVPVPKMVTDPSIAPRLNAKIETTTPGFFVAGSGPVTKLGSYGLKFEIRNRGKGMANKVRVAVTGMEDIHRIQAIDTGVANAVKFAWNLERQTAFRSSTPNPTVLLEYEDDRGARYEQRGDLTVKALSATEFAYSGDGLGPPRPIDICTIPWES